MVGRFTGKQVLLVLIIIFLAGTVCHGAPVIRWYHADFPPAFILSGEDRGTGYCDRMERDIAENLPEYEHEYFTGNYKRIALALKERSDVCCPSIYKTRERESFAIYSEPLFIGLANGVILRKNSALYLQKFVTAEGELDLASLLANKTDITIGLLLGRNYGSSIEAVISQYRGSERVIERARNDFGELLEVLINKRVDMILALPMEVSYALFDAGLPSNVVEFLGVKEGEKFTSAFVACSDSVFGREVIDRINAVIAEKRSSFALYYRDWLNDTGVENYNKLVEQVFDLTLPVDKKQD